MSFMRPSQTRLARMADFRWGFPAAIVYPSPFPRLENHVNLRFMLQTVKLLNHGAFPAAQNQRILRHSLVEERLSMFLRRRHILSRSKLQQFPIRAKNGQFFPLEQDGGNPLKDIDVT